MSLGWGQDCVEGIEVELWGECYNIEGTTELNLSESGFTGEIPHEIGPVSPSLIKYISVVSSIL